MVHTRHAIPSTSDLGAVAAGHEATARVGARVIEQGGNAVDAVVAMTLAACVCEGTLTTLGGGGFLLVDAPGQPPVVLDFFVRQPGLGPRDRLAPWESFALDLGEKVLQFGTGPASVAVPGTPMGMAHASSRYGRLPLAVSALPAIELAQEGVVLTEFQAGEHELNLSLFDRSPEGREVYVVEGGRARRAGESLRQPRLAAALEEIAATGAETFYRGDLARGLLRWSDERGGRIAPEDLHGFEVRERTPITAEIDGVVVHTNPAPAMGGRIIARMLEQMLPAANLAAPARDAHLARTVARVLRELRPPLTVPPVDGAIVEPHTFDREMDEAIGELTPESTHPDGRWSSSPNTTHVAAVDADGMFASATTTVGYGSGEFVPGTGIQLNNVLAEYDHRARRRPGATVPSMMSPTMLHGARTSVSIGSAGSDRIPQAISQALTRMWGGASLSEAVLAPRAVFDGERLHCEAGLDPDGLAAVEADGEFAVTRWLERNAYFGTMAGVAVRDGELFAQGDERREGAGIVVSG